MDAASATADRAHARLEPDRPRAGQEPGEPGATLEIDGVPVDVLPAKDGTPSRLRRSIRFQDLTAKETAKQ